MSNPVLNDNFAAQGVVIQGEPMTVSGAINKTFILFVILLAGAAYNWYLLAAGFIDKATTLMYGGLIAGLVLAIITIFATRSAMRKGQEPVAVKYLTPVYALCQGFVLGAISAMFESQFQGIVFQAIGATMAALFSMLFLFKIGAIRATEKFRSIIFISTLSIAVIYLIQIVASYFFGRSIPVIFGASNFGIIFSLIVVSIASLNFILDFDFIERASANMFPKAYEWYGAFGLMITLVWLYLEMLRLLAKLRSR